MSYPIYGKNAVLEAIKGGHKIEKLLLQENIGKSGEEIAKLARKSGIIVQYINKAGLDRIVKKSHQGVIALSAEYDYAEFEDLIACAEQSKMVPLLLMLDKIQDPHNLGAIIRSAEGAGVHGIIIPQKGAAGLTHAVAKVSAGAIEHMKVAKVESLSNTVRELKRTGFKIVSADMKGSTYYEQDLSDPMLLVIGGEDSGVSRQILELSDYLISIPMFGKINSLNASNATAVLLYEIRRQHSKHK